MDYQKLRRTVEERKAQFPKGSRVKLIFMDDSQAPKVGTLGTVRGVDDIGSILVDWDSGSSLNVLQGVDRIELVK